MGARRTRARGPPAHVPGVAAADARTAPADCPFCPGNEHETPPEVYRTGGGAPDTPGWRVRVVPNLYPIVGGARCRPGRDRRARGRRPLPRARSLVRGLDGQQAAEVLTVLRDRARQHLAAGRAFVQVVINHGRAAGASIEHPHAQIVALDFVPPAVADAVERFEDAGHDLVHRRLDRAGDGLRLVDGPVATGARVPGARRTSCASRSAPPDHASTKPATATCDPSRTRPVPSLACLAAATGDAPYNLVVHTAPPGARDKSFHWYVEVQARLAVVAGFEQGTGILVNTVPPELAAMELREAGGEAP